jgi:CBS domain-containing protein
MLVSAILARKGHDVFTVGPDASIGDATELLRVHGIGALVVSDDGDAVIGILSERDVVRRLAASGPDVLVQTVASVMTGAVVTCAPTDSTEHLMETVTIRRIRHLPVVDDGRLVGLVSIGDVVASRVHELEEEAQLLRDYITAR